MRDDLLHYYERELTFLRRLGAEFAERYPKVASRLQLEASKCEDPHVERLLEGFAFLAARVHLKIDDDFPELTESLLNIVYPHYVRPIPSMSLVQFHLDPEQAKAATHVPRDSRLDSRPVGGVPCHFRTCFDTTLWPLSVTAAQWTTPDRLKPPVKATDAAGALRLELTCFNDVSFDKLPLSTLRLHLTGETNVVSTLYEVMDNNCARILVRDLTPGSKKVLTLPASALQPAGFGPDEGMLPYPGRSFLAYRLLQEYFTFPEKFYFFDLSGFEEIRAAGFGRAIELVFLISPFERSDRKTVLEAGVTETTIRLGCTPIINLFPHTAEPVPLHNRRHEYLLITDVRHRHTVQPFAVDDVVGVTLGAPETFKFQPFYAQRHTIDRKNRGMFWHAKRRPAGWRKDEATDVYLSFTDLSGRVVHPEFDHATVRLTCFNGDLPSRLPWGDPTGDFQLLAGGPITRISALVNPTTALQPPVGGAQLWRLLSQLSLNYLSIVDGGTDALQEILRLHNFSEATTGYRHIEAITGVRSSPSYARVVAEHGLTFARGRRVELDLDEEEFAGGGVYLFASVLERFLGLYASINSFCVLAARTKQRKGLLREWPPRAGWKPLV